MRALLVNCIPPDHVDGMVSYLRDFTDLPLGVYPNLGYFTNDGWRFDPGVGGDEYARMALGWRAEGAQIIGGCCGTGPEHIVATRERVRDTPARPAAQARRADRGARARRAPAAAAAAALDRPPPPAAVPAAVPGPRLRAGRPGARAPPASWSGGTCSTRRVGAHQRCLDVGCGTGHPDRPARAQRRGARARDRRRPPRGRQHARRTRSATASPTASARPASTCYPWVPEERYEVIVASLYETPVDPFQQVDGAPAGRLLGPRPARPADRASCPQALAPEGVAYVVQLSVVSQQRTLELLDARRARARASSTTRCSAFTARARRRAARRSSASRSSATPTTCSSASTT